MKTMALILVVLAAIAVHVQAVIESMGVNTVEDARSSLDASDFKRNLRDGVTFMGQRGKKEGWRVRYLDLKRSPALGGKDVQL